MGLAWLYCNVVMFELSVSESALDACSVAFLVLLLSRSASIFTSPTPTVTSGHLARTLFRSAKPITNIWVHCFKKYLSISDFQ